MTLERRAPSGSYPRVGFGRHRSLVEDLILGVEIWILAFLAPFVASAAASAGGCIFWLAENYQGMQAQYVDLQKKMGELQEFDATEGLRQVVQPVREGTLKWLQVVGKSHGVV